LNRTVSKDKKGSHDLSEKEWKTFIDAFVYDTNALEGSKLSRAEVKRILRKGKTFA
jgi:hypothetical protein